MHQIHSPGYIIISTTTLVDDLNDNKLSADYNFPLTSRGIIVLYGYFDYFRQHYLPFEYIIICILYIINYASILSLLLYYAFNNNNYITNTVAGSHCVYILLRAHSK